MLHLLVKAGNFAEMVRGVKQNSIKQVHIRRYFQMSLNLFKKDTRVGVAIVTVSCCFPA